MSDPTDQPIDLASEYEKLKEENARLAKKVKSLKDANASWWNIRFFIGKKIGEVFLGWRLSGSIKQLVKEIKDKNVQNETIGDVLTHILWRFTRVGWIAILLAIIPSAILIIQTKLLSNQNKLLTNQNERIEQQNQLIEAERRSSYVFLMGNIMESVNKELSDERNILRNLTPQLKGQIISLSNSLIPYRFILENNMTTEAYSPERGMLLLFLLESDLNTSDLNDILIKASFKNTYLKNLSFDGDTILSINLNGSRIENIRLNESRLNGIYCNNCDIKTIESNQSQIYYARILTENTINKINTKYSYLENVRIAAKNIGSVYFDNTTTIAISLHGDSIANVRYENVYMTTSGLESNHLKALRINNSEIRRSHMSSLQNYYPIDVNKNKKRLFKKKFDIDSVDLSNSSLLFFDIQATIKDIDIFNSCFICYPEEIDNDNNPFSNFDLSNVGGFDNLIIEQFLLKYFNPSFRFDNTVLQDYSFISSSSDTTGQYQLETRFKNLIESLPNDDCLETQIPIELEYRLLNDISE